MPAILSPQIRIRLLFIPNPWQALFQIMYAYKMQAPLVIKVKAALFRNGTSVMAQPLPFFHLIIRIRLPEII